MLSRWDTNLENINVALQQLKALVRRFSFVRKGRGRKPKQLVENYICLIVLKEFDCASLRKAESRLTDFVVGERVDHSVIAYWENKQSVQEILKKIIVVAGAMLTKLLRPLFAFADSTKFSSWKVKETEVFVCNKIATGTVYPVGISFKKTSVREPIKECVPLASSENEEILADAWFDENKTMGILFRKGYIPIICPNKMRSRGFYRRKCRKLYKQKKLAYRQRGRGESVFGSLTNKFGDRFNAINVNAMRTRIASRILSYQIRILMRTQQFLRIVRHAQSVEIFKYSFYVVVG